MKQNSFTLFYLCLGILFIFLESLHFRFLSLILRALLMPSLIVFYLTQIKGNFSFFHRLIIFGLGFSWIGDVSLQFSNAGLDFLITAETFFNTGLGAFLITQILYIVAFSLPKGKNTILSTRIYQTLIVMAYGFILIWYLYRSLGDMKIPVMLYSIIILLMLLSALNRYGKVNGVSYMFVVIGAIIFVLSDSMIAIYKFHIKFDFARTLIMMTYLAAQYLIVIGCIRQDIIISKGNKNL